MGLSLSSGGVGPRAARPCPCPQGALVPRECASPGPSPSAGSPRSTHQLGQEEGVGDGEEQHDPQGHFGRGMAGGGRQVRGGHLSPAACCPWLRCSSTAPVPSNITSCPTHPSDVAWEGKKKKKPFQPSRSFHSLQPKDSLVKCECGFGFASDGPGLAGGTEARRAGVSSQTSPPQGF